MKTYLENLNQRRRLAIALLSASPTLSEARMAQRWIDEAERVKQAGGRCRPFAKPPATGYWLDASDDCFRLGSIGGRCIAPDNL